MAQLKSTQVTGDLLVTGLNKAADFKGITAELSGTVSIGGETNIDNTLSAKKFLIKNDNGVTIGHTYASSNYLELVLGNSTATSATNGTQGYLYLYGTGTAWTKFVSGNPTANNTLTLPTTSGTVALLADAEKVKQEVQTASSYTNWRPLVVGSSNSSTAGFTPTTVTDKTYVFDTITVQPSSGTIRAGILTLWKNNFNTDIKPSATANRTITLPDQTGTVALKDATNTFSAANTFTKSATFNSDFILDRKAYYAQALFKSTINSVSNTLGVLYYFGGSSSSTVLENNRFAFRQYSYTENTTTRLDKYEQYELPAVTAGKTSNTTYKIFTSKESAVPAANKGISLGSSSKQWNTVYANNIILSSTTNGSQTAVSTPAIRIGDSDSAIHLIIDRDAINAKATSTTVGALKINESGGLVQIGSGGLSTSGDVTISATAKGYRLTDSSGYSYQGICDNGTNLWLGAGATASKHHTGQTYISSGYDSTNKVGNESIYVSVPNTSNSNATNYMILHTGNPNRINLYGARAYTNGSANYFYKIATCSGTFNSSTNFDASLTLLATGFYGNSSYKNGILKAEVRWDKGNASPAKAILRWLTADGNIAPENYILTYKLDSSTSKVILNIYVNFGSATWESMNFTKLAEHTWGDSKNKYDWTLYQATGTNGVTAIPTGETQVPSTLGNIKANSITATTVTAPTFSGNATSATKVYATKSITNATQYFPMYASGNASGNKDAYIHPRFYIWDTGSRLHLCVGEQGTSTSDNTGAYSGGLTINSGSGKGKYVDIIPAAMTGHRTLTIPDASGTICLTSHNHDATYLKLSGGTMTGGIKRASFPGTWVAACNGNALINSSHATAGGFSPMMSGPTNNGRMTLAFYQNGLRVGYITKANCDAGTNTLAADITLASEDGGAKWPGPVVIGGTATIGGAATLSSTLTVTGATTLNGATTVNNTVNITNNTDSSSMTTGALKVTGGIGAAGQITAKQVMVNNKVTMKYDTTNNYVYFTFS